MDLEELIVVIVTNHLEIVVAVVAVVVEVVAIVFDHLKIVVAVIVVVIVVVAIVIVVVAVVVIAVVVVVEVADKTVVPLVVYYKPHTDIAAGSFGGWMIVIHLKIVVSPAASWIGTVLVVGNTVGNIVGDIAGIGD